MAATTMTPNRFGSSWSVSGQQAQQTADTPSIADTLPQIDFNFNELRERMALFTARFDEFIERGRKRVLEERNAFRMNVAELEDTQWKRKQMITQFESKSSVHAETLAKEVQETEEMHEAINSLAQQRAEHETRREELKAEIESVQATIRQRREAQAAHQRSLSAQARHNMPELRFWEQCLGLRIEGAGEEKLRFIFTCVDQKDQDRSCWFELDTSGNECQVATSKPRLEQEGIDRALETMQLQSGEFGGFLKDMRALFVEACKG